MRIRNPLSPISLIVIWTLIAALFISPFAFSPSIASAASAYTQINASGYTSQSGIQLEASSEGGQNVAFVDNGDYIAFTNIDFGSGATSFQARVASNASGGNIEIRLDSVTGTVVGTCGARNRRLAELDDADLRVKRRG